MWSCLPRARGEMRGGRRRGWRPHRRGAGCFGTECRTRGASWTVFVIAPTNAAFFFWAGQGFSFRRMIRRWPKNWLGEVYFPNLLANWCTWIPVVAVIYAFPLALQIQVAGFIGSFWTLMCLEIGRRSGRSSE